MSSRGALWILLCWDAALPPKRFLCRPACSRAQLSWWCTRVSAAAFSPSSRAGTRALTCKNLKLIHLRSIWLALHSLACKTRFEAARLKNCACA